MELQPYEWLYCTFTLKEITLSDPREKFHISVCGCIPEEAWCKNRLQQYTQRASIPLPEYKTANEGPQHAPQFRSQVWVDGTCFTSPTTFPNKKMAEQDAAKHALIGILEKVKNEGSLRVLEDTVFCKSIINEYVVRMNLKPPTYVTNESKAMLPIFVSSMVLNGVTYIGAPGKSKKEAEQFAARSAILSILDSESCTTMSEIVKSKFKFYDALMNVKDPSSIHGRILPAAVNPLEDFKDSSSVQSGNLHAGAKPLEDGGALSSVNKRKEVDVSGGTVTVPFASVPQSSLLPSCPVIQVGLPGTVAVPLASAPQSSLLPSCPVIQAWRPESTSEQLPNTHATEQPFHEFKKPKSQTSSVAMAPPIVFVPPSSEEAPICSTSGKKQKRRRRKAKKKMQYQSPLTDAKIPQAPVAAFSVAQAPITAFSVAQ
ncbi:hypothetical protein CDL12_27573 [Handroanthus impetiginosus]|uniref:DRBM domain-containing protein n=1 Tax=Handroanthus impetiginosus TaxID=429701 RepID=A0A2G9G3N4_9LAMI|nr:hypothetical protein CDL12_27573 [Handroanthus impetiginosus]